MKKFISLILAAVMCLFCMTGCGNAEDVVLTVDGNEVTWNEFMYWIETAQSELESYASYYGGISDWDSTCMFDSEKTNAEWCINRAKSTVTTVRTIEEKAEEMGIALDDEDEQLIAESVENYTATYCGEDATEADFAAYLEELHMSLDLFKYMTEVNLLYEKIFTEMYGENGEKLDAEAIAQYAEDNSYVTAAHILFMTVDENYEALSDSEIAEKEALAEEVYANLTADLEGISDNEAKYAKFKEYMNEYSEDTGLESYPDGYCFNSGMVDEFDSATRALDEYSMSEIVESDYGYHIIMRLPVTADSTVSSDYSTTTMGIMAASEEFSATVQEWTEEVDVQWAGSYASYDFTALFTDDGFQYVTYDEQFGTAKEESTEEEDSTAEETSEG